MTVSDVSFILWFISGVILEILIQKGCNKLYRLCAKHTQHAKHAIARGIWGHTPRKILRKLIEFGSIRIS